MTRKIMYAMIGIELLSSIISFVRYGFSFDNLLNSVVIIGLATVVILKDME